MSIQLLNGDCLEVLKTLSDCSVDAVVTDPPAGISFMGSGTTGVATVRKGFQFIGIEREAKYLKIAEARINAAAVPKVEVSTPQIEQLSLL